MFFQNHSASLSTLHGRLDVDLYLPNKSAGGHLESPPGLKIVNSSFSLIITSELIILVQFQE
jgi:hypothetical protein